MFSTQTGKIKCANVNKPKHLPKERCKEGEEAATTATTETKRENWIKCNDNAITITLIKVTHLIAEKQNPFSSTIKLITSQRKKRMASENDKSREMFGSINNDLEWINEHIDG